ncbi:MAG TPA: PAS domain-containing protein [Nitrospiraceae bacterium]|nr:PAS domain-containing protein [Nitrospiraceae bacterium]
MTIPTHSLQPATASRPPDPSHPRQSRDRRETIHGEQIRLLFANAPFALLISSLNALILVLVQRHVVTPRILLLWVGYMLVVIVGRLALVYAFLHRSESRHGLRRWERWFLVGTLLSGMGWGATGIWLIPSSSHTHQVFIPFLLAGTIAGAVIALSPRREAFLCFAVPTLGPLVWTLFAEGEPFSIAIGSMTGLFAALSIAIAERMYRTIAASLELRFDNQTLITDLRGQVEQRRQAEEALHQAYGDLDRRVRERTAELAQANEALRAEVFERQKIALALQESVERFNRAVLGSREGIWDVRWTSTDWFHPDQPIYYSPRFTELLGYAMDEFPGVMDSWMSRIHPDDADRVFGALRRHLEERARFDIEFRMFTKSGDCRWFAARGQAIWDESGTPVHMSGSLLDVTEHRTLEEQLLQAQKLEAVGRLAAGVAHDFNNLLTPILGYAEVLLTKAPPDSLEAKRLLDIRRAALHGATLVRQLLAFGRKQPVTPTVLDLNRQIRESEDLLRRTLGEDIELLLDLTPDLRPVKLDPTQLQQVILNLAANARDAMPEGGCLTFATASLQLNEEQAELPPGHYVCLTVTDTGAGMGPDVLQRAFEPFFTTKEVGQGSGLGLSVVEGIVSQAGGNISITSQVGIGTSFHILLPEAHSPTQAPIDLHAHPDQATGTILLVEDDPVVREYAGTLLQELGYQVLIARHGQEALAIAQQHDGHIHALMTDVVMPGMSGFELAGRLVKIRPMLRVLYVSGYQEDRLIRHNATTPVGLILAKPFTRQELTGKLRELLLDASSPSKGSNQG